MHRFWRSLPCQLVLLLLIGSAATLLGRHRRAADDESGFKPIFNGQNLDGWDGNPKFWWVEDGTITGQTTTDNPTKGNTFLIWRQAPVDDFVLRAELQDRRAATRAFSIAARNSTTGSSAGYQGDFEAGDTFSGILYEERGRGILAKRGQKVTIDEDGKKHGEQVTRLRRAASRTSRKKTGTTTRSSPRATT